MCMLRSPWTCNVSSIHQRSMPVVANFIKKQVQVKSEQLIIQKLNASSHLWEASQARPGHGILAPPIQQSRRICLSSLFTPFFFAFAASAASAVAVAVASRKSQYKPRYSTLRARRPDLLSCCVFVFTIQAKLRPPPPPSLSGCFLFPAACLFVGGKSHRRCCFCCCCFLLFCNFCANSAKQSFFVVLACHFCLY